MRIPVVLAALLGGLLVAPPAASAAAAPQSVKVISFNVCGNVCRHGEVTDTAQNIARQIRDRQASVAMLQELCYSQFLGVRKLLAKRGYSAVFGQSTTGGQCDDRDHRHGRGFGVAIVARGAVDGTLVRRLPSPHGVRQEPRVALAARVRLAGRPTLVVNTHTAPGGPNLALQLDAVRNWLVPIAAGKPVIFGGDLNSMPDNAGLAGFAAAFREADERAVPLNTFIPTPRKIDYIFGSQLFLTPRSASTACGTISDHCLYQGTFVTR
jgi:endonuclease/exonuclease/phosphatase family metal-dependent hydrolase